MARKKWTGIFCATAVFALTSFATGPNLHAQTEPGPGPDPNPALAALAQAMADDGWGLGSLKLLAHDAKAISDNDPNYRMDCLMSTQECAFSRKSDKSQNPDASNPNLFWTDAAGQGWQYDDCTIALDQNYKNKGFDMEPRDGKRVVVYRLRPNAHSMEVTPTIMARAANAAYLIVAAGTDEPKCQSIMKLFLSIYPEAWQNVDPKVLAVCNSQ